MTNFKIVPLESERVDVCAQMMATNDPWKRVGRSFDDCIANFTNPQFEHYALLIDEKVEGFLIIILNGLLGGGFIKSLFVNSEYQGLGLGKQLLSFGEQKIFSQFANAYLCVSSFNHKAQTFLQKQRIRYSRRTF